MTSTGSSLLLLGLRSSGKTSYLAALWHLVESGEIPASLTVAQLQPDREYLNRIRASWLSFEEVGRTPIQVTETISLLLRDARSGSLIDLVLPDVSGESIKWIWALRKAPREYAAIAGRSAGVLLFIHPDEVKRPATDTLEATQSVQWSAEVSPTQVQLTDILQMVVGLHHSQPGPRIAVIVSAWDLVKDTILPLPWLEHRLPLLHQYLQANCALSPFKVFGVSALGGDLQQDREQLQRQVVPSKRIRVVERKIRPTQDLTAPIRYLLGLED